MMPRKTYTFLLLMLLHNYATASPEIDFIITQVDTERRIDPTYATGDPDTFNSFGLYGSYPVTSKLLFDSRIEGAYTNHRDLQSAIVNFKAGFKRPIFLSDRLTVSPFLGYDLDYTYLKAQSPASTSQKKGAYAGFNAIYRPLLTNFEIMAGTVKSTNDSNAEFNVGLGYWPSKNNRIRVKYKDQGWRQRIEASIGFIF